MGTQKNDFVYLVWVLSFNSKLIDKPEIIKSSKNVNTVLYQGFTIIILEVIRIQCNISIEKKINDKECNISFTLNNHDNSLTLKSHKHSPMFQIECEIKKLRLDIDKLILDDPSW